ncbi:SOS response-associated peptidase [Maricaulis sp. CAU 1757]
MCGRYALGKLEWWILQQSFKLQQGALNLEPRWNIAPTQMAPIIRREDGQSEAVMARWGLVPAFWSKPLKEMKFSTFNAKAETAAEKPFFRGPFQRRHCIVPAIGFYEWTGPKGEKQPWFISLEGQDWFGFAGLWDTAEVEGETIDSFTILTTAPNAAMAEIHTRMPVMLGPEDFEAWLDPQSPQSELLLQGPPAEAMRIREANKAVGNVRAEGEWLTEPGDGPQRALV